MKLLIYFIVSFILLLNTTIGGTDDFWVECGTATCIGARYSSCVIPLGGTNYYCCPGPRWVAGDAGCCVYSVSISPKTGSYSDTSNTWTITATDSSIPSDGVSAFCPNTIRYLLATYYITGSTCESISLTGSGKVGNTVYIDVNRGQSNTFQVSVTRGSSSCIAGVQVIDPTLLIKDIGTYTVSPPEGGEGGPICGTYVNNCDSTDNCGYTRSTGSYNSCPLTVDQACRTETACNDGYDNDCDRTCDTNGCSGWPADSDCYVPPGSFNFDVSLDSTSGGVIAGSNKIVAVTVSLVSGTAQTVTLTSPPTVSPSVTNGPTVSLNPSSGTPNPTYPSTLTIGTTGSTPAGTYTITVTGTGGTSPILTRTATYTLTVSSTAGCGNGICEAGELQGACGDCETKVTISPYWVSPGGTAAVTVSFSDSRYVAGGDANTTLTIDGNLWNECIINNKKWKGLDIGWTGSAGTWRSGATTIESSNYNGKITTTCTIPSWANPGIHTLVAKPTIYSEPIELEGSETKIIVTDSFLRLIIFLIQPLKLLF